MASAEWKPAKLDELGFVGRGKSRHRPRNAAFLYGGRFPFFQTGDIKAANFHLTEYTQTYSDEGLAQSKLWKPGTLCITIAANIAESAILGIEGCFPDSVVGFVPDPAKADVRFIKYYMDTLKLQIQSVSRGTTQDNLSLDKLLTFDFRVPPLPMQRRIAGILSAYDELIENSQRRIRILESMARALYREWFIHFRYPGSGRETGSEPSTRPVGHPSPKGRRDENEGAQLVDSPLGEIPQGWEVKKLGDIAEDMRRNVPKGALAEPTPYVGLEHIPRRSLALDAWETATDLGSNKLAFKKGEVLFGKIRPYFHKVSVAPFDGLCSADTIVIRSRRPEHYAFVVACVFSDAFVAEASATANGAKMPRANWGVLEKYNVVIPKGKVAEEFSALFADIIAQQQALIFQIQNLRRTRDLLLPRLLSGQVNLAGN
jgi:type I restriction enzyme S subunit